MADLDTLNIKIEADAAAASSSINTLINSLSGLRDAATGAEAALGPAVTALHGLKTAVNARMNTDGLKKSMEDISAAIGMIKSSDVSNLHNMQTIMTGISDAAQVMQLTNYESVGEAAKHFKKLADTFKTISSADIENVRQIADVLRDVSDAASGYKDVNAGDVSRGIKQMGNIAAQTRQQISKSGGDGKSIFSSLFGAASNVAKNTFASIGSSLDDLKSKFGLSTSSVGQFATALGRIATYRFLRTLIKNITSGASEGLQNLAYASSEAQATLSQLSSAGLTMKNALGGALYSAIAPLVGILTSIANAAVYAMNAVSQLFAILGGRATYQRATSATKEYGKALKGAAGGAAALKQELMGFDEINSLKPDNGGGGGGGGAGALDYAAMFEETPVSERLKDMIAAADFTDLGITIANKINTALSSIDWNTIRDKASRIVSSFTTFFVGLFDSENGLNGTLIGETIGNAVMVGVDSVNQFLDNMPWENISNTLHDSFFATLRTIVPSEFGRMLFGKFKTGVTFLKHLLPQSKSEWSEIGTVIVGMISGGLDTINAEDIGDIIGNVITGGLEVVKILADAKTLTKIATQVKSAIQAAISKIKPEDVKAVIASVISDVWGAITELLTITFELNIAGFHIDNARSLGAIALLGGTIISALGSAFTGSSLMRVGGLRSLAFAGGVAFTIDAVAKLGKAINDIESGESASVIAADMVAIARDALVATGLFMLRTGNVYGLIPLAIPFAIGPVANIVQDIQSSGISNVKIETIEAIVWDAMSAVAALTFAGLTPGGLLLFTIGVAIQPYVTEVWDAMHSSASGSVMEDFLGRDFEDNFYNALEQAKSLQDLYDIFVDISNVDVDLDGFKALLNAFSSDVDLFGSAPVEFDKVKNSLEALVGVWASTSNGDTGDWESFISVILSTSSQTSQALSEITTSAEAVQNSFGNVDAWGMPQLFEEASDSVTGLNEKLTEFGEVSQVLDMWDMPQVVDEASDSIASMNAEISGIGKNSGLTDVSDTADTATASLKATGEQAEAVKAMIVEIPSTTIFNIQFNNYDDIVRKLDNLKSKIENIGGGTVKLNVKAGLTSESKTFLRRLSQIDASVQSKVNGLIAASAFAGGGYPKSGQLYIANENGIGSELIGQIGARHAVANDDQIGDAIFRYMDAHEEESGGNIDYNAMASAFVSACKAAGLGAVYLDGRALADSINRETRRAGRPAVVF